MAKSNKGSSIFINRIFQSPMINDLGLMMIRITASMLILIGHGYQKFLQMVQLNFEFLDPIGFGPTISLIGAASAEFIFPVFVIFGLFTRAVCIPIVFTMTVAGLVVHGSDPLYPEFINAGEQNMMSPFKEYALLYALIFATFIFTGPGRISLDRVLKLDRGLF